MTRETLIRIIPRPVRMALAVGDIVVDAIKESACEEREAHVILRKSGNGADRDRHESAWGVTIPLSRAKDVLAWWGLY